METIISWQNVNADDATWFLTLKHSNDLVFFTYLGIPIFSQTCMFFLENLEENLNNCYAAHCTRIEVFH